MLLIQRKGTIIKFFLFDSARSVYRTGENQNQIKPPLRSSCKKRKGKKKRKIEQPVGKSRGAQKEVLNRVDIQKGKSETIPEDHSNEPHRWIHPRPSAGEQKSFAILKLKRIDC